MFDFWLLGINARNLEYVKKFNPRKGIKLADDKDRTKRFLSERGIPVAETYGKIRNEDELRHFDFSSLPQKFVVKPNRGSKGRWIMIVKKVRDSFKTSGTPYEKAEFQRKLSDILQGEYSVTSWTDSVLIEETLVPSDEFSAFCEHWLADIRIIVFNLVPVAAMVRMPTDQSDGKANLAQWWVGFWLNVGNGTVTSCFVDRKFHSNRFPKWYAPFEWRKISHWNSILLHSSRIQLYTNLGYLALDWVITPDWPKLLEINARAWLEIQNVCGVALKDRLEKLGKMKVSDPEKGVEISKTLFNPEKRQEISEERVIYLSQNAKITFADNEKSSVKVSVDLSEISDKANAELVERLADKCVIQFENGNSVSIWKPEASAAPEKNEIILWRNSIREFYVKPLHKTGGGEVSKSFWVDDDEIPRLLRIDREVNEISRKLNVTGILRPKNYYEELDSFISNEGKYDPFFRYEYPSSGTLTEYWKLLEKLDTDARSELKSSPRLSNAYVEKIRELKIRIEMIEAAMVQNFSWFADANAALYGWFSRATKRFSATNPRSAQEWRLLDKQEILAAILTKLKVAWYPEIPVRFVSREWSRIAVIVGDSPKIVVSENAKISEMEIDGVLEHEIWTHLVRRMNGEKTWLKIFQSGTGFYLRDEEGLAVYRSLQTYERPEERNGHAFKYEICRNALGSSFSELAAFIRAADPTRDLERVFKACVRTKRWISDTATKHPWAAFLKDKVYADGLEKVEKWVASWGDPKRLLVWKIKIEDLPLFE